jgi:hypothetical protein
MGGRPSQFPQDRHSLFLVHQADYSLVGSCNQLGFDMAAQNIGNTAAVPVLASAELGTLLERNRKRKRTETTCSSIDNCLHGGIESGYLTCISGDKETGKSTVRSSPPIHPLVLTALR